MIIYVLGTNFQEIYTLDGYESLLWADRYYEAGVFEIFNDVNTDLLFKLEKNNYVKIDDSAHTMIIEDKHIKTDAENGNKLIITGRSLESIPARRIIIGQKVLDGNLQNGIEELLNECIISPVDTDRTIPNFVFIPSVDPLVTTPTVKAQYSGDNLYDVIRNLCESNNLGFKILLVGVELQFSLYAGVDRSSDQIENPEVLFSPGFENLLSSDYFESDRDLKTVAFMAGEGEGSNRITTSKDSVGGALTGLDRREMYVDASDLSQTVDGLLISEAEYIAQLQQRGVEKLSERVLLKSFNGKVVPTLQYRYGYNFFMGDIVEIENEYGLASKSRITEYTRSISGAGMDTYPTFKKIDE